MVGPVQIHREKNNESKYGFCLLLKVHFMCKGYLATTVNHGGQYHANLFAELIFALYVPSAS